MENCQLFERILLCNQQVGLPLTRNRINRFLSLVLLKTLIFHQDYIIVKLKKYIRSAKVYSILEDTRVNSCIKKFELEIRDTPESKVLSHLTLGHNRISLCKLPSIQRTGQTSSWGCSGLQGQNL